MAAVISMGGDSPQVLAVHMDDLLQGKGRMGTWVCGHMFARVYSYFCCSARRRGNRPGECGWRIGSGSIC